MINSDPSVINKLMVWGSILPRIRK